MNRKEAAELFPIIQAYAEGKAIESRCIKGDASLWYDDEDPSFDNDFEYRIKPEPKFRPFKNAEECWQEMQKHQPFGWIKTDSGYEPIWHVNECDDFNATFEYSTFADCTPFGVKVE